MTDVRLQEKNIKIAVALYKKKIKDIKNIKISPQVGIINFFDLKI